MRPVHVSSEPEAYRIKASTDTHTWFGDEPFDLGGKDSGPSPFELLMSAIGACTAITVQMYARRKQWPLESVTVDLKFEKATPGNPSRMYAQVALHGDLSQEQRERLLDIAGKCPVKRAVEGNFEVVASAAP